MYWGNFESSTDFFNTEKHYPPATAEQRERLEELIIQNADFDYFNKSIKYYCMACDGIDKMLFTYQLIEEQSEERYDGTIRSWNEVIFEGDGETRPDALYALTQKLVQEGVLSKGEVKGALYGNIVTGKQIGRAHV